MSMSCGIFVQFSTSVKYCKFVSFIARCEVESVESEGYQTYGRAGTRSTALIGNWRRVRNRGEDDDGFEYLRN
jgi:hypothetical protein